MELTLRDMNNKRAESFKIGELVEIKGVVFRVTSMSTNPPRFEVSPANADGINEYRNRTQPQNISKPSLSEPGNKAPEAPNEPPLAPPVDDAPEPPADTTDPDPVETGPGNSEPEDGQPPEDDAPEGQIARDPQAEAGQNS